ncbi:MAG: hypothetical protein K0R50_3119 [Eubacterium sp.]|jgi:hypothetical protein|nr:hypothetical protein [Eubacterium sp.]
MVLKVKTLAKWYKWILLAVIFQSCVLFYINNIFLNTDVSVSVTTSETKPKSLSGDFKVPKDVNEVKVSFNARFGAYVDNAGVLHIINIETNKDKKIAGLEEDKITYFKWLPDRDMVIYSSDTKNGKRGVIQMSTYEADSETTRDLPEITDINSKSKVMDIDLSPYTNVVYAKIYTSETRSKIIRFNVMNQYAHVMNLGPDAIIKECGYVNKLFYQNPDEAIYVYDGMNRSKSKVSIDAENVRILDIDSNDTLYIGVLDSNGKVTHIYQQKVTDTKLTDSWTKTELKERVLPEDITISVNGNMYAVNKDENKIVNLTSGLKASFRGDFLEMLNGALISKDGNQVNITSLKEY